MKKPAKKVAAKKVAAKKVAAKKAVKKVAPAKAIGGAAALPGKYDEPLASYSPYLQHRILLEKYGTDDAGQKKVFDHGVTKLGLPESQVKTYIREKLQSIARDLAKSTGVMPPKQTLDKIKAMPAKDQEALVDYKYKTREEAKKALMGTARRSGLKEVAFHIVTAQGKFAYVPVHILPDGKTPTFQKGDIVVDCYIDDSQAVVIEAGPEQSVIRYTTERKYAPKEQVISNRYLLKVSKADAVAPKAAKKAPAKKAK